MIRNLKVLGLALVAVFALSAMAASMASAQSGIYTSTGPFTLVSEEAGANQVLMFGSILSCPGSKLTLHKTLTKQQTTEGKTHERLNSGNTSATLTADIEEKNCRADGHKATVTLNGCDFDTMLGTTVSSGVYHTALSLVCPTGKKIEFEIYPFQESELGGIVCTITINEEGNQNLTGGTVANNGSGTLTAGGTFTGISASKSGSGCTTESTTTGEIEVNAKSKGLNEAGTETEVTISHT